MWNGFQAVKHGVLSISWCKKSGRYVTSTNQLEIAQHRCEATHVGRAGGSTEMHRRTAVRRTAVGTMVIAEDCQGCRIHSTNNVRKSSVLLCSKQLLPANKPNCWQQLLGNTQACNIVSYTRQHFAGNNVASCMVALIKSSPTPQWRCSYTAISQ